VKKSSRNLSVITRPDSKLKLQEEFSASSAIESPLLFPNLVIQPMAQNRAHAGPQENFLEVIEMKQAGQSPNAT
jgi:hypothetical protein